MERLNYFEPYENKGPWHEDQLTRAFLVVFRMVPLAQAVFLDLVRKVQRERGKQSDEIVPSLTEMGTLQLQVRTQVGAIDSPSGRLISVIMSDEAWQGPVEESSRTAIYDGVIHYGSDWILIIENKPWHQNIWDEQANPSVSSNFGGVTDKVGIGLAWQDLISGLRSLLEREIVHGAEQLILDDFLEFVHEHFPYLNPYASFRLCRDNEYLLRKRCSTILESLSSGAIEHQRGYEDYIPLSSGPSRKAFLYPKVSGAGDWDVILAIYPGDTVSQAREMFERLRKDDLLSLVARGWNIVPNLHFAHIQKHLHWCEPQLSLNEYITFWLKNRDKIRQFQRNEFQSLFQMLLGAKLISEADLGELNRHFTETNRNSLNLCPGLALHCSWPKGRAVDLDTVDSFKGEVRSQIVEALALWGQSLL